VTKIMLVGLTDRDKDDLVTLARNWISPPAISHDSPLIKAAAYDQSEKSYIIDLAKSGKLQFELEASHDAPLHNPAFVINNWGISDITLTVNGKKMNRGKDFRYGFRSGLENTDLVIWIRTDSEEVNEFIIDKQ